MQRVGIHKLKTFSSNLEGQNNYKSDVLKIELVLSDRSAFATY